MLHGQLLKTKILLLLTLQSALAEEGGPSINTPKGITQCVPVNLIIGGGSPPYSISILPGGDPSAPPLQTFPTLHEPGTITWGVDLPPGTSVTFQVRDSKGVLNHSSANTIAPGGDCSILSPFGVPLPASFGSPAGNLSSAAASEEPIPNGTRAGSVLPPSPNSRASLPADSANSNPPSSASNTASSGLPMSSPSENTTGSTTNNPKPANQAPGTSPPPSKAPASSPVAPNASRTNSNKTSGGTSKQAAQSGAKSGAGRVVTIVPVWDPSARAPLCTSMLILVALLSLA